ncbi:hypothetical protein ABID97_002746 [Variovorax sp. OAS795]|uniref:hypothetical protein n=1 Tax=Variovorax sp. OAS795 TaxID=3034231 RepID=UPI00339A2397
MDNEKKESAAIHRRFKRTERNLSHAIAQFVLAAEAKLDPDRSIYKREAIQKKFEKSLELAELLPDWMDSLPHIREDFLDVLARSDDTERILAEGQAFMNGLTPEELKRLLALRDQDESEDEDEGEAS